MRVEACPTIGHRDRQRDEGNGPVQGKARRGHGYDPVDPFEHRVTDTGCHAKLGWSTLACEGRSLDDDAEAGRETRITVNLSPRNLLEPDLPRRIAAALAAADVSESN